MDTPTAVSPYEWRTTFCNSLLEPTMNLRWKNKRVMVNPEFGYDERVLEQMWIDKLSGNTQWVEIAFKE
jgi:hypothetical protein